MNIQQQSFVRRRFLRGALAAAVLVPLAGSMASCAGGVSPVESAKAGPAVGSTPADGVVEIWAEGGEGEKLPEIVKEFEQANPNVKIKVTQVPADNFVAKMTAAIASGTVPDLTYAFSEVQPGLLATKGFDPVPEGVVDKKDFFENVWALSVVDGQAYGVPWYAYARGTFYRKDLLKNAGLTPPTTWDEYTAYAKAMKAQGVAHPVALTISYDSYTAWDLEVLSHQIGGGLINAYRTKWTINDSKNVKALEYWASFFKDGYASPDGPAFLDKVPWFTKGDSSSIFEFGPFIISWFTDANGPGWNDMHLEYSENPAGPGGEKAAGFGGASWRVPSDAKNKDASWKFVRYMSEPSSQVRWYKIFSDLPAVQSAWEDPVLADAPMLQAVRRSISHGVSSPNVPTWNQVGQAIGKQMERVARGTATAQEALDEAQRQAEAIGLGAH
jgi:multiple sugar transport system substrate-binding protein